MGARHELVAGAAGEAVSGDRGQRAEGREQKLLKRKQDTGDRKQELPIHKVMPS